MSTVAVSPDDYTGPKHFVHLHNHTVFSTLDGVATPEQYATQCAKRGYPAMSATEHGHMGSVPDMHAAFKKVGLKFIAGCEIYFCDYEPERQQLGPAFRQLRQSDPEHYYNLARARHLTILAKNETGYTNLIKLTTQAYRTGFYYRPRIWYDKLLEFKDGLLILSGCLNGPVCHELRRTDPDGGPVPRLRSPDRRGAVDWIRRFRRDFGADYYIELQMPGIPGDDLVFRQLVTLADHLKIPIVLANDCWNGDAYIQTATGSQRLRDVRPGDMVWTHRGRLREVMAIGKRRVREDETIYGLFGSRAVQCTGNHKLLAKIDGTVGFVPIEDVPGDAYINVARINLAGDDLPSVKISDYVVDPRLRVDGGLVKPHGGKTINPVPDVVELTDEFLWVLGLFVAEGATDSYRLSFGHHAKEMVYAERIKRYFSKLGFKSQIKPVSGTRNGIQTRICSSGYAYFLAALCGSNRYTKRLPPFWTRLSMRQLVALLRGYFDGDGSIPSKCFFTTSIQLMSDLMQAFAAIGVGVTPSLRPAKDMVISNTKKRGRVVTRCSEGYYGHISKIGLRALGYDVDFDQSKSRPRWHLDEDGVWIKNPFTRIDSDLTEVWCIQVDDDNSFLVGISSSNCHYLHRADFELQKVMMAIDQDLPVNSPDLFHVNSDEQYMKSRAELWARFHTSGYSTGLDGGVFERACDNTLLVAERCRPLKIDSSPKIPSIDNADKELARIIARRLHTLGLDKIDKRYLIDDREVTHIEQAKLELERIIEKGYSSYFLITHDLINFGLERGWPFSPRGSAGGSLVNYLLGISPINPLPWRLSFDRFLSPSRGGFMQSLQMPPPIGTTASPKASDRDPPGMKKWVSNEELPTEMR
jgi:hypothetical protein